MLPVVLTVAALLTKLARAFPREKVRPETFELYATDLHQVDPEVLDAAVTRIIRTSEFFPTVRAIREACAEILLDLPTEAEALAQAEAVARWQSEGMTGDAPPVHALTEQAVRLVGGYREFRINNRPNEIRSQFTRYYRDLRNGLVTDVAVEPAVRPTLAA